VKLTSLFVKCPRHTEALESRMLRPVALAK
jgi:hypothetical protein